MRIVVEGEALSAQQWTERLDITVDELISLLELGIFEGGGASIKLTFVGMVVSVHDAVACLPKYFASTTEIRYAKIDAVQKTLQTYTTRRRGQAAVQAERLRQLEFPDDRPAREYELYITALEWFRANGVYLEVRESSARSPSRPIHWPLTLSRSLALQQGENVIYSDPVRVRTTRQPGIISAIQIGALRVLHRKYALDRHDPTMGVDTTPYNVPGLNELRRRAGFYSAHVAVELGRTFRTDTVAMLRALKAYLDGLEDLGGDTRLSVWGTSSFHVVWEDACIAALADSTNDASEPLSQPRWCFSARGGQPAVIREGGHQRPDVIVRRETEVLLLDAKYYYPLPDAICGWADLVKQYFYELSLRETGLRVVNALLFPDERTNEIERLGEVLMYAGQQRDAHFPPIRVIGINPHVLFDAYVRGQRVPGWADLIASM
jgi:hypothetical protein